MIATRPQVVRPDWETYYLNLARAVAARAECVRAQHGAVIVSPRNRVIATGYNGSPSGWPLSCLDGDCPRAFSDAEHNAGDYGNCIALHAEQNAIASCAQDMYGGTIYVTGPPCPMCSKLIVAAGLTVVHP